MEKLHVNSVVELVLIYTDAQKNRRHNQDATRSLTINAQPITETVPPVVDIVQLQRLAILAVRSSAPDESAAHPPPHQLRGQTAVGADRINA